MAANLMSVAPTPFEVPALKVGTLDDLMGCSDDLVKVDSTTEAITYKLLHMLEEVHGTKDVAIVTRNVPGGGRHDEQVGEFLANFHWNEAQYPINKPLKHLIQTISEQIAKGEEVIRTKASEYNDIKTKLQNIQKKSGGTLLVKPIANLIKDWHTQYGETGPLETHYLTTVFVCVPTQDEKKWLKEFATLGGATMVVPDSCKLIVKEQDYCLYNVVLFQKIKADYIQALRENKYTVREYLPNEEVSEGELEVLNQQLDAKKNALVRWLKTTFSESFAAWIHLKAIRIFVESILRYGLPPNFVAMLFQVDGRKEKDVRKQLANNYSDLNAKAFSGEEEADSLNALEQNYPYVSLRVR
eukprot:NODE_2267_length_1228_cov_160.444142_g2155_i0.p1 GENE.NODE_2267_length_1228_cov_160.444142_g2155_i0~~NODE_2267_length_1228_cov_160.444142_g2155_i0.p1  ORF type:complete len:393 (+),score=129.41 NODE_2267_length_1228_cov_160.444142_g2155_i0:113-1180(+)